MNTFESVKGKIAIVTGGTSGIGREIAKTFAANGMHVVFSGRNEERGNRIVNDIVVNGGDAMFVKADVRSEEDIRNLVEVTVKKYGKLHVMVNNAGVIPQQKPLHEYDLAEFNRINERTTPRPSWASNTPCRPCWTPIPGSAPSSTSPLPPA